ncbi:hypothetical protein Misp01_63120 [Microtetraspora sp. NBRC 13810]|uniref:GNAT family N-acetyltransferase n=1 Tax=Microtetraspora sp. NBRC 13810 TaxID=3030990 RepID=UPI00249FC924|nr:GNAT family N-acetyltransferase [Microtetraspora sp. NBRC 13810]GLW11184.1 hypothetical protein Misp01_63120 [Microtetraspora sp. NBRC 13810]
MLQPADTVVVRPAGPDDEEPVRAFLAGLSLRTCSMRFFAGVTRPSASMVRSLLALDGGRDALLAVHAVTGQVVGHAMSYRYAGTSQVEIAVVVADEWQGRGHGSRLVGVLLARAVAEGAETVGMDVLGDNRKVLSMIRKRWPEATARAVQGTVEIVAAL